MKIKKTIVLTALIGLSLPLLAEDDANVMQARGLIKQFGGQLKGELQAAMKSGGPVQAIDVCHVKAPVIASSVADASGWAIARTSLKLRNQGNTPDAWEQTVLEAFEARKADGEPAKTLDYSEVVEVDGVQTFRYMKAIPTAAVCLNCHGGDNVKAEVAEQLQVLYPDDQARGYHEGDLRGAFTLQKTL